MKTVEIVDDDYSGNYPKIRVGCRALIFREDEVLMTYVPGWGDVWAIPGGGLEPGESDADCVVREMGEETGYVMEPAACAVEIVEYHNREKTVNRYYFGEITGECERNLTENERENGLVPRWIPIADALSIFADYEAFAVTFRGKRDLYLREYTALQEALKVRSAS